jgi:hypothetical protein
MHLPNTPKALLALLVALPSVLGHSWIEQIRSVDDTGNYVGEYGYPRGFKSKDEPGYDSETSMNYLLPPLAQQPPFIDKSNLLCHPNQRKAVQSEKWPRVKAKAGGWVSLRYAENGHVSNPASTPPGTVAPGRRENGGSVFVFGTTAPKDEETIANVLQWNKDGSGGDKAGVLLGAQDYDDGRCYEINPVSKQRQEQFPNFAMGQVSDTGPGNFPLMCESNAQIPTTAPNGKPYTLYWVWQWPMEPGKNPTYPNGKDEYYTTCMDVDVVDAVTGEPTAQFAILQQDAMAQAANGFRTRTALIEDPIKGEVGDVFNGGGGGNNMTQPSSSSIVIQPSSSGGGNNITQPSLTSLQADIPTLTQRPDEVNPSQTPGLQQGGDQVTVTVTTMVTKTAAAVTQTIAARAEHVARHGVRPRQHGRYYRE